MTLSLIGALSLSLSFFQVHICPQFSLYINNCEASNVAINLEAQTCLSIYNMTRLYMVHCPCRPCSFSLSLFHSCTVRLCPFSKYLSFPTFHINNGDAASGTAAGLEGRLVSVPVLVLDSQLLQRSEPSNYILGDPEITANTYCKSRNLPNTDTQNYSTDLR